MNEAQICLNVLVTLGTSTALPMREDNAAFAPPWPGSGPQLQLPASWRVPLITRTSRLRFGGWHEAPRSCPSTVLT